MTGIRKQMHPNIPFTKVFTEKENLTVFFSEDFADSYETISSISEWFLNFREVMLIFPEYQVDFFKDLLHSYPVKVMEYSAFKSMHKHSLIIDLTRKNKAYRAYSALKNAAIVHLGKNSNVNFVPKPASIENLLEQTGILVKLQVKKRTNIYKDDLPERLMAGLASFTPARDQKQINYSLQPIVIDVNHFFKRFMIKRALFSKKNPPKSSFLLISTDKPGARNYSTNSALNGKVLDLCRIIQELRNAKSIVTDNPNLYKLLSSLGHEKNLFFWGNEDFRKKISFNEISKLLLR